MKILVIDNYDSFTYNLVHYLENATGSEITVVRNDQISLDEVDAYDKILLSPGPGIPNEAGICLDLIKRFAPTKSIFGVCLGHQAIGEAFGGSLINLETVYHGVSSMIDITAPEEKLYEGLPARIEVGRYHSWVIAKDDLPDCFVVNSMDENGMVMGISHKEYDVKGVQYHPESVLTENGMKIIENWIKS